MLLKQILFCAIACLNQSFPTTLVTCDSSGNLHDFMHRLDSHAWPQLYAGRDQTGHSNMHPIA